MPSIPVRDPWALAEKFLDVLMTCNTTERLDPAVLRKGRVDFVQELTHRFV